MKKLIYLAALGFMFLGTQAFAAPHYDRGPSHHHQMHRPPIHRHYVRVVRPIYTPYYYSTPIYTYYSEPGYGVTQTVVVRENSSNINTAANVINAAANVATAIRLLTW